MAIRYNLWLDPDNVAQHRAVEADLERYFMERFADFPISACSGPTRTIMMPRSIASTTC